MTALQNYIDSFYEIRKDFYKKIFKLYDVISNEEKFENGILHTNVNKYIDLRWFSDIEEYDLTPKDGKIELTWNDYDDSYYYDLPYEFFTDFENYIKNLEKTISENNEKAEKEFANFKKSEFNGDEFKEFLRLKKIYEPENLNTLTD